MEVDAFLILVLSVYVARSTGAWVLAIGAARYVFVAAGWLLPWLRGIAAAALLVQGRRRDPGRRADGRGRRRAAQRLRRRRARRLSLALLAESFGREVWWLWAGTHGRRVAVLAPAAVGSLSSGSTARRGDRAGSCADAPSALTRFAAAGQEVIADRRGVHRVRGATEPRLARRSVRRRWLVTVLAVLLVWSAWSLPTSGRI